MAGRGVVQMDQALGRTVMTVSGVATDISVPKLK
jgi:hypothetical protein